MVSDERIRALHFQLRNLGDKMARALTHIPITSLAARARRPERRLFGFKRRPKTMLK